MGLVPKEIASLHFSDRKGVECVRTPHPKGMGGGLEGTSPHQTSLRRPCGAVLVLADQKEFIMAKSSIHIDPGNPGYFSHNSRQSFSQSQVFFDETNEVDHSKEETFALFRSELAARTAAYEKRVGQKLQKNTVTELSAIVNLEQHHTLDDLQPIVNFIQTRLDTIVIQQAVHRDEGKLVHKVTGEILTSGEQFFCNPENKKLYFDQEYTDPVDMNEWRVEKNYHAHLEMLGIDSNGKSIRRNLTTTFFRELQDLTAETLGMERGKKTQSYTKEQMQQITTAIGSIKDYPNQKAYATAFATQAKKMGIYIDRHENKRKDTQEYKKAKAIENKAAADTLNRIRPKVNKSIKAKKATITQLKELNKKLRIELQQSGGTRKEFAALEEEIRQLKLKIKAKELTEAELRKKIDELNRTIQNKNSEIDKAEDILIEKIEEIDALKIQISDQEQTIEEKDAHILDLEVKNQALKAKIATLPSPSILEELKTLKIELEEEKNENWKLYYLAYDDNHVIQEVDEYEMFHDRVPSYKEKFEALEGDYRELKSKVEEKTARLNAYKAGYRKIEEIVFGENKSNRKIKEIIEGVSNLSSIVSNVSKYFNQSIEKIKSLFGNGVPDQEEVEEKPLGKIESTLKENMKSRSSSTLKRRKP